MTANEMFSDDAFADGFSKQELCRAVEIWFHVNPRAPVHCVADAARVFNVTPDFLADALDEAQAENPEFFAGPMVEGDAPGSRILDCAGA